VSRSPGVRKVARGGRAKPLREESSEEDGDSDRWVCVGEWVCVGVCVCVFVCRFCLYSLLLVSRRYDCLCFMYVFLLFSLPFVQ